MLQIPENALIVLVGASGSGKTTFCSRHFLPTEVVSSDRCRALVCDDEACIESTRAAFELVHFIIARRLEAGRLTVVDATSVQVDSRKPLLALAGEYGVPAVALVFDLPLELCLEQNNLRPGRRVPTAVVREQHGQMVESIPLLEEEGFTQVEFIRSIHDAHNLHLERLAAIEEEPDALEMSG
ncbi:MAG: AAA family ATPase [Candidatus Sumerlaeaceae bacterium]|nr:AAA family ATPase [Candidatus Sumerlaeaceae bacterium]